MMKGERLNPVRRDILAFKVAECDGRVVGAVQVRKHPDGARELGSLIVERGKRGQGIAAMLIGAWLNETNGPVYMITGRAHADHYRRFGFAPCTAKAAPRSVRFHYMMGRMGRVVSFVLRLPPNRLCILKRA
jgi:amino-acid N-acetyltransferase